MNSYSCSRTFLAAVATALCLRLGVRKFCPTSTEADGSLVTRRRKGGYKMPKFDQEILDDYLDAKAACERIRSTYEQARSSSLEEDGTRLHMEASALKDMVTAIKDKIPDPQFHELVTACPPALAADIFSTPTH